MLRKTVTDIAVDILSKPLVSGLMKSVRRQCIPVFMLHRMEDPALGVRGHTLGQLEAALTFIKQNNYSPVSIADMVDALIEKKPLPERAVAFTMDDGFYDQFELAFPMFQKYQTPVTLFLATDMIDHGHWSWDYRLEYVLQSTKRSTLKLFVSDTLISETFNDPFQKRHVIRKLRNLLKAKTALQANQAVLEIADQLSVSIPEKAPDSYRSVDWQTIQKFESDIIQFGPHTCSHHVLTQLEEPEAKNEILKSWQRVNEKLTKACPVFCYPTGRPLIDFGEREKNLVKSVGLKAGLSAEPGYVETDINKNDMFSLKRFSFSENMTHFKQYCSWIERMKDILKHTH